MIVILVYSDARACGLMWRAVCHKEHEHDPMP